MNPSQALKQKIEAMAETMEMQWRAFSTDDSGACIEKPSDVFIEAYECGAQSLVPLVESLAEALEYCHRCEKVNEALTNYRKFIGG